jgi:flagellar hook-associated protein 2
MSGFRVDGLASGLDTTTMIEQLMAVERRPITLLQQKRSTIQLKKTAWADIGSRIENLRTTAQSMLQSATIAGNKVRMTAVNPPFSATADPTAVAGTYSVKISQLATGTIAKSTSPLGADVVSSDKLKDINFPTAVKSGSFSINGVSIAVDASSDSLDDVVTAINGSAAGVNAALVTVDGHKRLALSAATPGGPIQLGSAGDTSNFLAATKIQAAPRTGDTITATGALGVTRVGEVLSQAMLATPVTGAGTLTINNVEIDYNADTESLNTVINRINASSAGVTASYDTVNDRFVMQNKQTGAVTIAMADTGGLLAAMGVDTPAAQTMGANAAYSVDGGVTTRYSSSNTVKDAIAGVTLDLTATSTDPVSFTIGPDTDSAVAAVKKFVEQFNSTMSLVREKLAYDPDTKKAGTLMGDAAARGLERALRAMPSAPAVTNDGVYSTLNEIGISFGAVGSAIGSTDTLKIDETKLREALTNNSQAVFQLFGAQSSAVVSTPGDITGITGVPTGAKMDGRYEVTSDGSGGVTVRFIDSFGTTQSTTTGTIAAGALNTDLIPGLSLSAASTMTGATTTINVNYQQGVLASVDRYLSDALGDNGFLKTKATNADNETKQVDDSIKRLEDRIEDRKTRLVAQFARLETTIAKMQAQSAALSSQLAGLMNSSQN